MSYITVALEPFFASRGISYWGLCNDHISAHASALVVVLDSLVGFLSERKGSGCVPRRSRCALGSYNLPALYKETLGHGCILSAKPVPHFDCFSAE